MNKNMQTYIKQFEYYKLLAEKAIDQCEEQSLFRQLTEVDNSIAVIMKHIAGNQLSRWTNFLTEDGEKDWRNRDQEFEDTFQNKEDLMVYWQTGWACLFSTLSALSDSDLEDVVYIRNMGCSVHDAIIRQLCHYSYHIGQIVFLARHLVGENFLSLSIPKNGSEIYIAAKFSRKKEMKNFIDDMKEEI